MDAHSSFVRVRYAETDKMGVAYHANYFIWFEVARCELLRTLGESYRDLEGNGVMLPVIEAHCHFNESAQYDDELEISTTVSLLSPVRIEFNYTIIRGSDEISLAFGRTVHAAIGLDGRPHRLPVNIQEVLA